MISLALEILTDMFEDDKENNFFGCVTSREEIDEAIEELKHINNRSCNNCNHLKYESGSQPDGLPWSYIECEQGSINSYQDINIDIVCCKHWEEEL